MGNQLLETDTSPGIEVVVYTSHDEILPAGSSYGLVMSLCIQDMHYIFGFSL